MPADEILDLARQVNPKTEKDHISTLSGGFSSQAYKVAVGNEPFVLLVQRPGAVSESNYGHAYVVMTLLQKHGLGHAPNPLWLKDDHMALAISFYDGEASDDFDFKQANADTEKLAINVIDTLLDTAIITQDEYTNSALELNVKPLPIETPQSGVIGQNVEVFRVFYLCYYGLN